MPKQTTMLAQYRSLKACHADALLLYRLGDFYELFEDDAKVAAREVGLALTSRKFSKDLRLPMCGIPHQRLNAYVARLINKGHKIAIAEQLEDARKTRRLVKRDVVRVITPGTVVEEALLREREESLLVSIVRGDRHSGGRGGYGIAAVDLSTGEFWATQISPPHTERTLSEELRRLSPSEVVLPQRLAGDEGIASHLSAIGPARVSPLDDAAFAPAAARHCLEQHLGVASLEGFGCDTRPLAVAAAGGVLSYLQRNQVSDLAHIVRLTTYDLSAHVGLDAVTCRNLELVRTVRSGRPEGSLYETLDRTFTAMGGRLLRRWLLQPLTGIQEVRDRQDAIEELFADDMRRAEMRATLDGLYDVERLVGRIGFGNANARDLVALRLALERIPRIRELLEQSLATELCRLEAVLSLDVLPRLSELIARAIGDDPPILLREGGIIRRGYDEQVEQLRQTADAGRDWLTDLEARERERTGIKNLRVRFNQVFGFYIEVTKSYLDRVPPEYERRATVRHAERFATPELKAQEAEILASEERMKEREYDLFVEIRARVASESEALTQAARTLAELDTLAALAEVAARNRFVRPTVDTSDEIVIRGGRHPVVEHRLPDGERFVPNDTCLTPSQRLLILTGPNMSGKSVYIRQVALIVLMAQIGSFVPATEARIGMVDRVFVRAGASDDITQGRSTFLVEMSETSYILRHATTHSLVVLDEVGRGTSTYDGVSIAWAVAEELHNSTGARTLFATHFHELTRLSEHLPGASNYTLAISERGSEIVFLRQLVPGGVDKSYGIHVARLAGLPESVVARAREVLAQLEQSQDARRSAGDSEEPQGLWAVGQETGRLLRGIDAQIVWEVLERIYGFDIANMTPVQALVALNALQSALGRAREREDLE